MHASSSGSEEASVLAPGCHFLQVLLLVAALVVVMTAAEEQVMASPDLQARDSHCQASPKPVCRALVVSANMPVNDHACI